MKRFLTPLFFLGLSLAIGLVAWRGFDTVAAVIASAGWQLLWLIPNALAVLVLTAVAWGCLFAPEQRLPFSRLLYGSWVGDAVNHLLPVAQIGGELVKARLAARFGVSGSTATASVVVDKTVQALTTLLFVLMGLALFVHRTGGSGLVVGVLTLVGLVGLGVFTFYRLQRRGLFTLAAGLAERLGRESDLRGFTGGAAALDAAIHEIYTSPDRILAALLWRLTSRLLLAGEVWFALLLMGHPVGFVEALVLQSLGKAARGAAFFVPGGLGVQEGSFMLVGAALGVGPDAALALSLAKRFREVMVGLPGLVGWQLAEGRLQPHRRIDVRNASGE